MRGPAVPAAAAVIAGIAFGAGRLAVLLRRVARQRQLLRQVKSQLIPSQQQLAQIEKDFLEQLESGLQQEVDPSRGRMLMLPTYVTRLPNGEEVGDVYAIDIGGTNFRVMYVHLADGKSQVDQQQIHQVAIPSDVYTGTGRQLFDFLAKSILEFMAKHEGCSNTKQGLQPTIGFCWSFPLKQTALNRGILLDWTKGFTCDGVIGNDPVQLLSEALERAGRPCQVLALLNDTVGVLAAQRYLDPDTAIGVIIGTGTNACYVERVDRVTKWQPDHGVAADVRTCINIEWGAFDSPALPRCQEDWDVDAATVHKGKYMFEKLLSGMFLGEVARRVLLRLAQDPTASLFGRTTTTTTTTAAAAGTSDTAAATATVPVVPAPLTQKGGFTTAHLAAIVDAESASSRAAIVNRVLGVQVPRLGQQAVHEVCRLVAQRSAVLVAGALHAIMQHSGWTENPRRIVVTFDGGVYEQFAGYRAMLRKSMVGLLGKAKAEMVEFALTKDGSCLGAAVLAAAAARERTSSQSALAVA